MPHKRKPNDGPIPREIQENRIISSFRVRVEHVIG